MGNGEAKELTYTTHGHELRGKIAGGKGDTVWRRAKGEKWNCNSITNKIYFKKITQSLTSMKKDIMYMISWGTIYILASLSTMIPKCFLFLLFFRETVILIIEAFIKRD